MDDNWKEHIQTDEINFVLSHVCGYRLTDRMRNEYKKAELGILFINNKREQRKQQWIEHVYRMYHPRLVKRVQDYKPVGRRVVGLSLIHI